MQSRAASAGKVRRVLIRKRFAAVVACAKAKRSARPIWEDQQLYRQVGYNQLIVTIWLPGLKRVYLSTYLVNKNVPRSLFYIGFEICSQPWLFDHTILEWMNFMTHSSICHQLAFWLLGWPIHASMLQLFPLRSWETCRMQVSQLQLSPLPTMLGFKKPLVSPPYNGFEM